MVLLISFTFAATTALSAADMAYSLKVTVDISPGLKGRTRPDQTVFIFAKAVQGPRAPLAAVRAQVKDLPMTVTLDDSKAMAPMFKLSRFKNVKISARVSQNGGAMKMSGDLEGVSPEIRLEKNNKPVNLTIDHVVK
ncbi:MAG: hypothetical protein ACE5EB_00450 [Thermodesulfobacteriota bacterium]